MIARRPPVVEFASLLLLTACGSHDEPAPDAVKRGSLVFERQTAATEYSCATCHSIAGRSVLTLPGGDLAGVVDRPMYWGGTVLGLLDALNACRVQFMHEDPWQGDESDARDLYAFLQANADGNSDLVRFTIPQQLGPPICPPRKSNPSRGRVTYHAACLSCHGDLATGDGRLFSGVTIIPDETLELHAPPEYSDSDRLRVFEAKVRHGGFFDLTGVMPPFSNEVLDDEALQALLDAFGLYDGAELDDCRALE